MAFSIQHDPTDPEMWIFPIQENINKADENAGAMYYLRMIMANEALYAESTNERIHASLEHSWAEGKKLDRPPALTPERVEEYRRTYAENPSLRRTARITAVFSGRFKNAATVTVSP